MKRLILVGFSLVLSLVASIPNLQASASSGPLDTAFCTVIDSLPVTISTPGNYCLKRNLVCTESDAAVIIAASNVTLDLNGYEIAGTAPGSFSWPGVWLASGSNVTLQNGTVRGFQSGVLVDRPVRSSVIQSMVLKDCSHLGMQIMGSGQLIRGNRILNINPGLGSAPNYAEAYGVIDTGGSSRIIDNDVMDVSCPSGPTSAAIGISAPGGFSIVENNRISNSATPLDIGLSCQGPNSVAVNNRVLNANRGYVASPHSGSMVCRDNLAVKCTTPYTNIVDAGNNH
ncbi:MAG: right-handed parallel beta-helix repeat-containing protein [Acidobacteria bacterium]|nr:right-handed parallel beta-helix repeat-containing protein [Acidobacteriota bacterium]MBI3488924.1 right-handed parallel beta-helix repeat-containing protein [Acidobacteriota bacterium]